MKVVFVYLIRTSYARGNKSKLDYLYNQLDLSKKPGFKVGFTYYFIDCREYQRLFDTIRKLRSC